MRKASEPANEMHRVLTRRVRALDPDPRFAGFLKPDLSPAERAVAQVEGWILGVPGLIRAAGQRGGFRHIRGLRSELV
jgi:hypothetical protein